MMNFKNVALAAIIAMTATMSSAEPVSFFGDIAVGGASGNSVASALSTGTSMTGGLSSGTSNGTSFFSNESSAGQVSLARSSLSFTETDGGTLASGSVRNDGIRTTTGIRTNVDAIEVLQLNEAYTEGFDKSRSVNRSTGLGTVALGGSIATRYGSSQSAGGYALRGVESW